MKMKNLPEYLVEIPKSATNFITATSKQRFDQTTTDKPEPGNDMHQFNTGHNINDHDFQDINGKEKSDIISFECLRAEPCSSGSIKNQHGMEGINVPENVTLHSNDKF